MSLSNDNMQAVSNHGGEKIPKRNFMVRLSRAVPHEALKCIVPLKQLRCRRTDELLLFLVKVAALETVRRFSRSRCPFIWKFVQALQVLVCPPFKWIQRWPFLHLIVKAVQNFSRPMLFLSMATAFSDHSEISKRSDNIETSPQPDSLSSDELSNSDMRECEESDSTFRGTVSENWVLKVVGDLEKEGISLPERINEDELRRFYSVSKGDLSFLLSTLKKTIRWRETYYLLSPRELEMWSPLLFWHGLDVMHRPCLVIRLGHACCNLSPRDRPRFAQAVVSQIEHGVLHLVNDADPKITVLVDCERLSPARFPMQMMKTCVTLVQDNYPDRLAILLVVRLPSVSRDIAQTFIEVLKPETRQKLRIEGGTDHKELPELLQSVPRFLGANCNCYNCQVPLAQKAWDRTITETSKREPSDDDDDDDDDSMTVDPSSNDNYLATESLLIPSCDRILRAAVLGILMLCIVIAIFGGLHDPEPIP